MCVCTLARAREANRLIQRNSPTRSRLANWCDDTGAMHASHDHVCQPLKPVSNTTARLPGLSDRDELGSMIPDKKFETIFQELLSWSGSVGTVSQVLAGVLLVPGSHESRM